MDGRAKAAPPQGVSLTIGNHVAVVDREPDKAGSFESIAVSSIDHARSRQLLEQVAAVLARRGPLMTHCRRFGHGALVDELPHKGRIAPPRSRPQLIGESLRQHQDRAALSRHVGVGRGIGAGSGRQRPADWKPGHAVRDQQRRNHRCDPFARVDIGHHRHQRHEQQRGDGSGSVPV